MDHLRTPLWNRKKDDPAFQPLASTPMGDGDLYYLAPTALGLDHSAIISVNLYEDRPLGPLFSENTRPAFGDQVYRSHLELVQFDCDKLKYLSLKKEYFTAAGVLLYVGVGNQTTSWDVIDHSPLGLLRRIVCGTEGHPLAAEKH